MKKVRLSLWNGNPGLRNEWEAWTNLLFPPLNTFFGTTAKLATELSKTHSLFSEISVCMCVCVWTIFVCVPEKVFIAGKTIFIQKHCPPFPGQKKHRVEVKSPLFVLFLWFIFVYLPILPPITAFSHDCFFPSPLFPFNKNFYIIAKCAVIRWSAF